MKKKMIKNLLLVALMAVLCVVVGMTASALEPTGQCGDNVYWTFDETTGELVISGEGEMWDNYQYFIALREKIKTVCIESGVTSICDRAFERCGNIESIELPDSLTSIGKEAFFFCRRIKNIKIPDNVISIGEEAFYACASLTEIVVGENNKNYCNDSNGVLFSKDKSILIQYPMGSARDTYDIPADTTTIAMKAFYGCMYLRDIVIPDNVKVIGEGAFMECYGLENIVISQNVTDVMVCAFACNPFLEKAVVKGMDTNLGETALCANEFGITGITRDEFVELMARYTITNDESIYDKISEHFVDTGEIFFCGTIYCHSGSTAEKYAIENGVDYVLTHFFEGEWTYDYDNMIRYRKCIHCDELETEALETTGDSDVEIIEPVDPDTDFTVDVVEDYVVIEETISNNITTDFEIVKAFDINLKNKDGVHVQPDGTVKVKLPLDWSKDGVYKVYRVNDDGTLTDMNAYRQGSHMVFDTDHFSLYVIVDESEKSDAPVLPDEPQEETKDNFFTRLLDLIKSFFDLIMSWFKK